MQQTQQNYILALVFLALGTLAPAIAAAASPAADPLLAGTQGPCDPRLDGPDYVAGTDVDGHPVTPAELSQAEMPAPSGLLVPLAGRSHRHRAPQSQAYAELSQKDVASILNPEPACPARKAR